MSKTILLATQNVGKQREMQQIFADLDVAFVMPAQVGLAEFDVDETGQSFEENARLKAVAFANKSGLATIADDSGLEVAALNGAPGVFSKRLGSSDADRISKLLSMLTNREDRSARFRCVLIYFDPISSQESVAEGVVEGVLASQPVGKEGFGYDPIFVPSGFDQTFAQLGADIKNGISHRARAALTLKSQLKPLLLQPIT